MQYRRWNRGRWIGPAAAGFAAGAIVGGALAPRYYDDGYYAYGAAPGYVGYYAYGALLATARATTIGVRNSPQYGILHRRSRERTAAIRAGSAGKPLANRGGPEAEGAASRAPSAFVRARNACCPCSVVSAGDGRAAARPVWPEGVRPMCDYSLEHVASRAAEVGDRLVSTRFGDSITRGFAAREQSRRCGLPAARHRARVRTRRRIRSCSQPRPRNRCRRGWRASARSTRNRRTFITMRSNFPTAASSCSRVWSKASTRPCCSFRRWPPRTKGG